jgi:hypothetical protein
VADKKNLTILFLVLALAVQQGTIWYESSQISSVRGQLAETSEELDHLIIKHDSEARRDVSSLPKNQAAEGNLVEATFHASLTQTHRKRHAKTIQPMNQNTNLFPELFNDLNELNAQGGT